MIYLQLFFSVAQLVSEVTPPDNHFICCTVEGKVKVFIHGGLKPGNFIAGPSTPYLYFMEQETQDVPQLFWVWCVGDVLLEVVQREHGLC